MTGPFEQVTVPKLLFPPLRWVKGCSDIRSWAVLGPTCLWCPWQLGRPLWGGTLLLLLLLLQWRDSSGTSQHLLRSEVQKQGRRTSQSGASERD